MTDNILNQIIEIWGTPNCQWCEKAKTLISGWGDEYKYIELTPDNYSEFQKLFPGYKTVPQMISRMNYVPDYYIHGYEALVKYYER